MLFADGLFTNKQNITRMDTKRMIYFLLFIMSFVVTEFGRFIYRPFIYQHDIFDFGIADSIGNLGGILVQIFFGLFLLNSSKQQGIRLIGIFGIGYIAYEILQPFLPKGTFDWKDIYGTLVGGTVGMILFLLIHKFIRSNKVFFQFNSVDKA